MKINLIGTIFGSSGYASHTRQLLNALIEEGQDVKLEANLPPEWMGQVNDKELAAIKKPHYDDGVTVMVSTPPYWVAAQNEPCTQFYGFCVWEGDKVPKHWLPALEEADGILVPSQHTKDAILATMTVDLEPRIHIVPHGVDTALFTPKEDLVLENFTFVVNKGWSQGKNDRGGVQWALQAFSEEFKAEDKVDLKVKVNTAYNPPGWSLQEEIGKLGLRPDRKAILMMADTVDYKKMPAVYEGHCFINSSMAEAFAIPCAEAMACALPVITTDFGGQLDYVDETVGWKVEAEMFEVTHDIAYEGIYWARPLIPALRAAMRYAYEHQDEVKIKGQAARERIESWTWRNSALRLIAAIQERE